MKPEKTNGSAQLALLLLCTLSACTIDEKNAGSDTNTETIGTSTAASSSTGSKLSCSDAVSEEACGAAAGPDGLKCRWLNVYDITEIPNACEHALVSSRCLSGSLGAAGSEGCCGQYSDEEMLFVVFPGCLLIMDEGWSTCCSTPPPSDLCRCLEGPWPIP